MNEYYLKYLKYRNKYKNNKFILNGGMKEVEFELHGTTLTVDMPNDFICPIIREIMEDPVVTCEGYSYERTAITHWLTIRRTNPVTNQPLLNINLIPNHSLRGAITDFKESIYAKKILELTQQAEQNNSNAQYELGVMYSKYPDIEKSMHWLNKAVEQHHAQAQLKINQINERLERERLERQQEFNIIFNNINQTIRNKHNQIGSSISNYTDVLSSFGYTLLETHNSSTLGDCVNRISTVPRSIKNQHISRLNSGSDWDNRFELYENGNYIIGCQRCLKLWDHECCCVVYKKE